MLAGAADQPALDHALVRPSPELVRRTTLGADLEGASPERRSALTRRALIGELGALALGVAGIAALAKGEYRAPAAVSADTGGPAGRHTVGRTASGAGAASVPDNAVKLAASSRLPAQQGATYTDPADGQPDIIIRQADGSLTAFSAVCTHAAARSATRPGRSSAPVMARPTIRRPER